MCTSSGSLNKPASYYFSSASHDDGDNTVETDDGDMFDDDGEEIDVDAIQEKFLETERRVSDANQKWVEFYGGRIHKDDDVDEDGVDGDCGEPKTVTVSFSCPSLWRMISEDPGMSEALQEARTSDLARRRADKARMEMLLSPILKPEHRDRVFKRLYQRDD